ncbi:helix-turn-helix domain-containing protein [Candidatus Fukatsuia symbiotica]|nr:helix-turn-helix domain-containing protein [Candidatus Fukatsuia symbiotica]MEA9446266.1 helix-turn-helix domain-containing protein [Candidatus Fukatsuia symbiotica]
MKNETVINSACRITQLLKKRDWSQSDLARLLGVTPQAVQQWVKGISSPRGGNLAKLSEVSGLPKYWFFMDSQGGVSTSYEQIDQLEGTNEQHKILIRLFDSLPEIEKKQLIKSLYEKQQYYDQLLEELATARGKNII